VNVVRFTISTKDFGEVLILRPYPKPDEPWGDLAILKDTVWSTLIPVVSGAGLSHALHGRARPLMLEIGPPPKGLLRMVPPAHRKCREADLCIIAKPNCVIGRKTPDCFMPSGVPAEARPAANLVVSAWLEGRYVIVVKGVEFSF